MAEGQYEGARTLAEHGATPIRYLDKLGVLGERMIGVHCVWLDDDEVRLMGERGAGLAYCPSSNMILGDGITRITELQARRGAHRPRHGRRLHQQPAQRLRGDAHGRAAPEGAASRRHSPARRAGLRDGDAERRPRCSTSTPGTSRRACWPTSSRSTSGHPSLHPPTNLLKSVVYAMSPQAITDVWVHGRQVVKDQRLATLDQGALMERVRTLTRGWTLA